MYRNRLSNFLHHVIRLSHSPAIAKKFNTYWFFNTDSKCINYLTLNKCFKINYSKTTDDVESTKSKESLKSEAGAEKYKIFSDFDSPVILDVDEERHLRLQHPELFEETETNVEEFKNLNLERGETGVFDIEELAYILRKENAINLWVVRVPSAYQYVDYMVIVSGRSLKHIKAMAEFIKKLYKRKKSEHDYFPIIEGKNSQDWMAIDLGNIALHFQTQEARKKYDIEMLWSLGSEYDDQVNAKEDQYITLLNRHTAISDLEPLDSEELKNSLG